MKRLILFLMLSGVAAATLPFPIQAGKQLAAYAKANGYTAQQVNNETPEQVFTHLNIDPNSARAREYRALEPVIKGHAINFLGMTPTRTEQSRIKSALYSIYKNLLITYNSAKRLVLLDLDGQYPNMKVSISQADPNIITIDLDGE